MRRIESTTEPHDLVRAAARPGGALIFKIPRPAFFALAACTAALAVLSLPARAVTVDEVRRDFDAAWKKTSDYRLVLSIFFNYSDTLAARFKDKDPTGEGAHWNYVTFQYVHKKPGLNHFKILKGRNFGSDYVSKMLEENPGTRIINGYDPKSKKAVDDPFIFVRFDPKDKTDPGKASLARTIYHVPESSTQSWLESVSFRDTVKTIFDRKIDRFKKEGSIAFDKAPFSYKTNLRVEKKKAVWDEKKFGEALRGVYTPKNVNANRGITKEIVYINPKTAFPLQFEAWEGDALAACFVVQDLELNVAVPDKLWESFFKDGVIVDQKQAAPK